MVRVMGVVVVTSVGAGCCFCHVFFCKCAAGNTKFTTTIMTMTMTTCLAGLMSMELLRDGDQRICDHQSLGTSDSVMHCSVIQEPWTCFEVTRSAECRVRAQMAPREVLQPTGLRIARCYRLQHTTARAGQHIFSFLSSGISAEKARSSHTFQRSSLNKHKLFF